MSKQQLLITAIGTDSLTTVTSVYNLGISIDSIGRISGFPTPTLSTATNVYNVIAVSGRTLVSNPSPQQANIGLVSGQITPYSTSTVPIITLSIDGYGRVTAITTASSGRTSSFLGPLNSLTLDSYGRINTGTIVPLSQVISNSYVFTASTVFGPTVDIYSTITNASGVVTHDFSKNSVWYHKSISGNFIANLTNFTTTSTNASLSNLYVINLSIFLEQGATPFMCNGIQINGTPYSVKWFGGSTASGVANSIECVNLTIFSTVSNVWTVLASKSNWK